MRVNDEESGPADAFARLALELHEEPGVEETVEAVVQFALRALNCDHANFVLKERGKLEILAATDPITEQGIRMQLEIGEGPCLAAFAEQVSMLVPDTATEERWPVWAGKMAALGLRCVLSIPIQTGGNTFGALNLVSDTPDVFETDDEAVAHILARHAAVALSNARQEASLWQAVDARKLIGQAQGILMERYGVDDDRAFAILRRYSQDNNLKLRDVAKQLIETRRLPD
jgi:GAF domain-containing protein